MAQRARPSTGAGDVGRAAASPDRAEAAAREFLDLVERRYRDPHIHNTADRDLVRGGVSLMRMFEYHQAFRDLLVLQPVIGVVERILGTDCHVVAQNALRTPTGKGIIN